MYGLFQKSQRLAEGESYQKSWPWPLQIVINGLQESAATLYQQISENLRSESELSFYEKSRQDERFQHYQFYCDQLAEEKTGLLHALRTTPISPQVLRDELLRRQQNYQKDIISPLEYDWQLTKLERQVNQTLKLPRVYGDVFREARYRLKERLQSDSQAALQSFYDDIIHRIIALSNHQLKPKALNEALSYYQGLVPENIYQFVQKSLKGFIENYRGVTQNPYEKSIKSTACENLVKEINQYFTEPQTNSKKTNPSSLTFNQFAQESQRVLNQLWKFVKGQRVLCLSFASSYVLPVVRAAVGEEFQVNTYVLNNQGNFAGGPSSPKVASQPNGDFLIVWESEGEGGLVVAPYGQLYDISGNSIGNEFRINNVTSGSQGAPCATPITNGSFAIIWHYPGVSINARIFDGLCNPLTVDIPISTTSGVFPAVTQLTNGSFVTVWQALDSSGYGIFGQRFDSNGNGLGSVFQINTYAPNNQANVDVASFTNGSFVAVWWSDGQDGSSTGVYGQFYDVSGNRIRNEFRINNYTPGAQDNPSVASFTDDRFIVVWLGEGIGDAPYGIFGQQFDNAGNPTIGSEFLVNTYVNDIQGFPSVATLPNGNFVVVWHSNIQDGSGYGIYGQLFNTTGSKLASEFQINSYTLNNQFFPDVKSLSNGHFVVTWISVGQDGSGNGIYARIINPATLLPITDSFFTTLGGAANETGYSVALTSEGGYITTGYTQSIGAGNEDVLVAKWTNDGALIWQKTLGGINYENGRRVIRTRDDHYIVSGFTASFGEGNADMLLTKWSGAGQLVWAETVGGVAIEDGAVIPTSDGGYFLSGYTMSAGAGNADVLLAKLDGNGTLIWAKTLGGVGNDYVSSVIQIADGSYITVGHTQSFGAGSYDVLVARWTINGNLSWVKTVGGIGEDVSYSAVLTTGGSYVVAGTTQSFGAGQKDMLLMKFDVNGTFFWAKSLGGVSDEQGFSIVPTMDGGYVVSGETRSYGAGDYDVFLVKWNSNDSLNWAKSLGGLGEDRGWSIVQALDGGYIQTGETASFGEGLRDMFLAKWDREGNIQNCNLTMTITPSVNPISPIINVIFPTVQNWNPAVRMWSANSQNSSLIQHTGCDLHFSNISTQATTGTVATTGRTDITTSSGSSSTGLSGTTAVATTGATTGSAITTSSTGGALLSTTSAKVASSSQGNQSLYLGVGIAAGTLTLVLCIGGVTYVLVKKHRNAEEAQLRPSVPERSSEEIGLEAFPIKAVVLDSQKSETPVFQKLTAKRGGKHTPIGDKYWLINEFSRKEAKEFYEQTGLEIPFAEGENKARFTLDEGQFGKLKIAQEIKTGRFLAVKKVKGAGKIAASKSEVALHAKLNGRKNIIFLYAAVEMEDSKEEKALYLFMELAGFGNGFYLSEQLALLTDIAVKEKILVHIAQGLLTALAEMHALGIYHLDLKPTNFVLDRKGEVRVIDFGCAVESKSNHLKEGNGDSRYYSPERLACLRHQEGLTGSAKELAFFYEGDRSELWAVGVTLLELLLNNYPLDERTENKQKIDRKYRIRHWDTTYFTEKLKTILQLQEATVRSLSGFIKSLLEPDAEKSLTVERALSHPIFQNKKYLFSSEEEKIQALMQLKQLGRVQTREEKKPEEKPPKERDENYAQEVKSTSIIDEKSHNYFTPKEQASSNLYHTDAIKQTFFNVPKEPEQENPESQTKLETEKTRSSYQSYPGARQ